MKRIILAVLVTLAIAGASFASIIDHLTGTAAPSGWTFPAQAGNGVMCMNGTIVAGAGGSCPAAVTGESFFNFVTAANADAAFAYRTTPVSFTTNRIYRFYFRSSTTGSFFIYLNEGVPASGTNANVFGTAGKALMRIEIQNAGANVAINRYANDASRTRTQWNTSTQAWATPSVNASTTLPATYQRVDLEIDGTNRRWRVHIIGQTGTANTPDASMHQVALTDWVNFSFHEGGTVFCNPTCGTTYLTFGEPLTDGATGTGYLEWYAEDDGTAVDMWTNGRNAGGTWSIWHNYAYPDANGVPTRFVPDDRSTPALAVGGAGAWDEQQVKDPSIFFDGSSTYYMTYSGSRVSDGKFQVGCASAASKNGPWTKCTGNPIIPLTAASNEDQTFNPVIFRDDGEPDAAKRWKIIYIGTDLSSPLRFRAFVRWCSAPPTNAACDTAAEWSAATLLWDVGGVGSIDEAGCGRASPYQAGSTFYLQCGVRSISGGVSQSRNDTYGTSSSRLTTAVTKTGTITNAAASSNCNTTLTAAITTPGTRDITVASTTGCNADDPVVMDDDAGSTTFHVNRILVVVDATHLRLWHNEDAMASGGRVRSPQAFWQIDTGPVRTYSGGYLKYATCFDAMIGGGSTFDAYTEISCVWTGPSPLGPWTLYSMGNPIIPFNSFGRSHSNENPAFINTAFTATSVSAPTPAAAGSGRPLSFPQSLP